MKYIKLFEEKIESEIFDIIVKMANCDLSVSESEYSLFLSNYLNLFYSQGKKPDYFGKYQDIIVFFREFFSNLRKNPKSIEKIIFRRTLFNSEAIFREKSKSNRKENYYRYVPSDQYLFFNCLSLISKNQKYNFFDLGSGLPIKVLAASLLGHKSIGFEINKDIIKLSEELGISDLIKDQSIYDINFNNLSSPKVVYYYNPIFNPKEMAIYENEVINNLTKGDILFRVVLSDVDKFVGFKNEYKESDGSFGYPINFNSYNYKSGLAKYLNNKPEIFNLKLIHDVENKLGPSYTIWEK